MQEDILKEYLKKRVRITTDKNANIFGDFYGLLVEYDSSYIKLRLYCNGVEVSNTSFKHIFRRKKKDLSEIIKDFFD